MASSIPSAPRLECICKKGCTTPYTSSENYHNRIFHQETVSIKLNGHDLTFNRDAATRYFTCSLCHQFRSQDPERLRDHLSSCKLPLGEYTFSRITNDHFYRIPDANTVTFVEGYQLLSFNVVVHKILKAIICIQCHHPVLPPSGLPHHVRSHISALHVPTDLVKILIHNFQLEDSINYPSNIIEPVYGIPLLEEAHFFCQACNQGYQSLEYLRSHQTRHKCTGSSIGYGQLIPGSNRRIIKVNIDGLLKKKDINIDYLSIFRRESSSRLDYSKIPIPVTENESNLTAFFRQDGWVSHVQGHTPADLYDARRTHEKGDYLGEIIRDVSRRYLVKIQAQIEENINYGLLRNIGTTNV